MKTLLLPLLLLVFFSCQSGQNDSGSSAPATSDVDKTTTETDVFDQLFLLEFVLCE